MSRVGKRVQRRPRWFREDVVAWLLVAVAGASIVVGNDVWFKRRVLPAHRNLPDTVLTPKIVILAFDRIVTDPAPNQLARNRMRDHLTGLAREGFVGVSLEDVARFYESGTPLPRKSLVLTFDHGYLSTYHAVDPLLREQEWPAALFLMTERQARRDPFFVYWDRVTRMVASGLWQVGSHGHHGHDPVTVDADGNEGPFFVRARWVPEERRVETWMEFGDRVRRDHQRALDTLEREVGQEVLAYAPPRRDVVGLTRAPEVRTTVLEIVQSLYRLAFLDDRFGINDSRSDPRRLRRLRVDPRWSSDELIRRIRFGLGDEIGGETDGGTAWWDRWVTSSGRARRAGRGLVVAGDRRADVWRAGSQWVDDWELEGDIYTDDGELWIVQESEDGSAQWRFGGTEDRLYLQVRRAGERTHVVQRFSVGLAPGRWHHVRLIKRGVGLWAELDGEVVTDHPAYLPGQWRGNVGIVHWGSGQTELHLKNVRFRAIPFEARVVSNGLSTDEIQAAIAVAPRLSAISPRLFELTSDGFRASSVDQELLGILSRRFAWEIVPTLSVMPGAAVTSQTSIDPLLSISRLPGFAGLRVEWNGVPRELHSRLVDAIELRAGSLATSRGTLIRTNIETTP